jgi:hypothetical protein
LRSSYIFNSTSIRIDGLYVCRDYRRLGTLFRSVFAKQYRGRAVDVEQKQHIKGTRGNLVKQIIPGTEIVVRRRMP